MYGIGSSYQSSRTTGITMCPSPVPSQTAFASAISSWWICGLLWLFFEVLTFPRIKVQGLQSDTSLKQFCRPKYYHSTGVVCWTGVTPVKHTTSTAMFTVTFAITIYNCTTQRTLPGKSHWSVWYHTFRPRCFSERLVWERSCIVGIYSSQILLLWKVYHSSCQFVIFQKYDARRYHETFEVIINAYCLGSLKIFLFS